jgi:hypothetical protein
MEKIIENLTNEVKRLIKENLQKEALVNEIERLNKLIEQKDSQLLIYKNKLGIIDKDMDTELENELGIAIDPELKELSIEELLEKMAKNSKINMNLE